MLSVDPGIELGLKVFVTLKVPPDQLCPSAKKETNRFTRLRVRVSDDATVKVRVRKL